MVLALALAAEQTVCRRCRRVLDARARAGQARSGQGRAGRQEGKGKDKLASGEFWWLIA